MELPLPRWFYVLFMVFLVASGVSSRKLCAQSAEAAVVQGSIHGTVMDPRGQAIARASVTVRQDGATDVRSGVTDGEGRFAVAGLSSGTYRVDIVAPGFAPITRTAVQVGEAPGEALAITLSLASVAEQVTVSADDNSSAAAQLSPVHALLDAGSARTEISNTYIRDFTSPLTDFTDIMQIAPGTFSVSPNGVGLGQSNTFYRGFADGDYTITYDGIPFEDTNSPTHHSWAFFPGPTIGGVDFDRSPGTASDIGPTNFGGSIHLLSPLLGTDRGFKVSESYGSFNTQLIEGQFNTGLFGGKNPKANLWFEGNHLSSDGYESFNYQRRTAGALKFTYKFSDKTVLSLFSSVVILDSNTPNNGPTRAQIAQFGDSYLLDGTQYLADGTLDPQWYRYYFYHVPTDFEYVGLTSELGHGWKLDTKGYTYSYFNHQHYNNKVPLSVKSAIDKLNSYNRIGDTITVSSASKYGVFRTGLWYEWSYTNRYQVPSDPTTWIDQALPNFHENFWTNSVQPFAEYQYVAIPRLTLTAGIKDAYYNMSLKQYADNGKVVGSLGGAPYVTNDAGYNSWLPSVEANYRLRTNWSAYAQFGKGSVIPPSSVFDVTGAEVKGLPKPSLASTYQVGSVVKFNRISLDADAFYIRFQNAYSSAPDASGFQFYFLTPDSHTRGFEAEGNVYLAKGLSLFLNGTVGSAKYLATATTPDAWVASTPHDTESEGMTYQDRHWDVGIFNKRIGTMWNDNGAVHQAVPIDSFSVTNLFFNYTIRNGSRFDQSKVKLSFNNLFDNHNVTAVTPVNAATSTTPFSPAGGDQLTLLPARSVMVSFQFGLSAKER